MRKLFSLFIAIILLFLTGCIVLAQTSEQWHQRYNGPANGIDLLSSMILDDQNNIYIAGRSSGLNTNQDYCIVRYSPFGTEDLIIRYDGTASSWDEIYSIDVDHLGNIYITGISLYEAVTIKYNNTGTLLWTAVKDSGSGKCIRVDQNDNVIVGFNRNGEIIISKYSPTGIESWSTSIQQDSTYGDNLLDMETDKSGNVYITGQTRNQVWEDEFIFSDIITIKLDSSGNELWRKIYSENNESDDFPIKLHLDSQNNIIIGARTENFQSGYIIIKYTNNGDVMWTQNYNGQNNTDIATDITIDSKDNIIITGYSFVTNEDFNILTMKYSPLGNKLWTSQYNRVGNTRDFAFSSVCDSMNNIYITGGSRRGFNGYDTCVTIKYDKDGSEIWTIQYTDSVGLSSCGKHIAIDKFGDVIVAGNSIGSNSGWDYFTVKYRQTGLKVHNTHIISNIPMLNNYPNPFNNTTIIHYNIIRESNVIINIYDLLGRQIIQLINNKTPAGFYQIEWDGRNEYGQIVPTGFYLCTLNTGNQIQVKKILLIW